MFHPLEQYDQVFCSIAERLRERGAINSLKIVVITSAAVEGPRELDLRNVWPQFSALGEVAVQVNHH